ncbi:MAG: cation-translocating P-type ATPase [Scytolyngbya sp. HA4215-MV1]|jgi:Ca2+-transporting ATPase|nr:cation-translocating P-type ATPase [Scytolyngbya sp. HA4215-MV1]
MHDWYQQDVVQILQQLGTDASLGLSDAEASQRLTQHGANELTEHPPKSPWLMLWEQFTATTVLVLIAAAIVSVCLQEYEDAAVILAIVIFNAILGFSQEYRAGQEFAALKQLAIPKARVFRQGQWQEVLARELVVGDIVRLEDGDQIPADARLLESTSLRVQESAFTGESEPVEKNIRVIAGEDLPLGDRHNMVYMGTIVTYGRGRAVVTETGMETELGKIAGNLQGVEQQQTPLQRRLDQLGKRLAVMSLVMVAIIFVFGLIRGENLTEMFLTSVSLAVAIIPEGLPAVVTIALALGARRMLKRHALIRKLPAVETLGSVTTICSDKTGTLTENRMTVTFLGLAGQRIEIKEPYAQITSLLDGNQSRLKFAEDSPLEPSMALILTGSALCNNALLKERNGAGAPQTLGDPTEVALVVAADRFGLGKDALEQTLPRIAEAPFDSDRKRMTTIHEIKDEEVMVNVEDENGALYPSCLLMRPSALLPHDASRYIAFTKGAVDNMLEVTRYVWSNHKMEPLTPEWEKQIRDGNNRLASTGTRVLGVAFRLLDAPPEIGTELSLEQDLAFVGLVGMLDPARPEAKTAVQTCAQAGIRTVMITGDHPLMAKHIAEELDISTNDRVLTGKELNRLSIEELESQVETVSVYARVSPQQKLKIVEALQNRGQLVSMTGDGVNDAPALSKADIGVAMGITGTDVAKEAADMVLLNDNFATIVAAIEEGRVIYDNIRKFIRYSLTGNTSGVVIMLFAPLLQLPLPLLPAQILWINLLADGLLALALSVEPAESNVMRRPPYPPGESVFSRGVGRDIIWVGTLMGMTFLLTGYYYREALHWQNWQTMVFATLAFSRIWLALGMRSVRDLLIKRGLLSNRPMLASVVLTFGLQMAVLYFPWLQKLFQTKPLTNSELLICLAVSTIGFWAVEIQKLVRRQREGAFS